MDIEFDNNSDPDLKYIISVHNTTQSQVDLYVRA